MTTRLRVRHKEDSFRGQGIPAENLLCGVVERAAADLISADAKIQKKAVLWFLSLSTEEGTFLWMRRELKLERSADSLYELARFIAEPNVDAENLVTELQNIFREGSRPAIERLRLLSGS